MRARVLVADTLDAAGVERLRAEPELEVEVRTGLGREALVEAIPAYDGLVVRSSTQVTAEVLEAGKRLRVVGRAGVGVDNIDVEAATRRGVLVVNAPEGNTLAAAEHTLAMLLAAARWIPQAHASLVRDHQWDRKRFMGVQLQGKVLGVVGLGRIGSEVARRARALGMRVLAYDPFIGPERAGELGVELRELEAIYPEADAFTLHTPLTEQTRHLLGAEAFARMKRGVILVNCARGGLVDEAALLAALESGQVRAAALDVFEEEPPRSSPLLEHPHVVATPHLGASTHEAQLHVALEIAEQVARALKGEPVAHAVNAPGLPPELARQLEPYVRLAQKLGELFTGWASGAGAFWPRVEVVYSGSIASRDVRPLTNALLVGLLQPVLQEAVNAVNAPVLARQRQLRVNEVREADGGGPGRITVRAGGDAPGSEGLRGGAEAAPVGGRSSGPPQVSGTVDDAGRPILVAVDGYPVHVSSTGHVLLAYNRDQPGVIGAVGTLLGQSGVNIAFMQVGRRRPGEEAVMVLGLDNPIPDPVARRLREFDELWHVVIARW
ncbi:phosphoglycerate dehydrogenase [Limnochorda pilosa]|uniref:D-3-phosphoglycerate dehydrogenase n=1 Tax=Limnochorda pilosa TaxID=1555112 RepID=A0A0K2SJ34_LIMPI|nr:phosphoglycerate dehydrogenase [Limnochorda pilosa]BAS27113.1 3-phosphoglycerate dehydrogenase [Limnochorda pilosa]